MDPFNPIILHDLGLACLEVGYITDAISALRRAVDTNPDYADAHFRLGIALEKKGDVGGAIVSYDRATKLLPSLSEAWFRAGSIVYELGHRDEAIVCFRRAAAAGGKTSFGRLGKAQGGGNGFQMHTGGSSQELIGKVSLERGAVAFATEWYDEIDPCEDMIEKARRGECRKCRRI